MIKIGLYKPCSYNLSSYTQYTFIHIEGARDEDLGDIKERTSQKSSSEPEGFRNQSIDKLGIDGSSSWPNG